MPSESLPASKVEIELKFTPVAEGDPELRLARKWFLTEFQPRPWDEIKSTYLSHTDEDRWFRMTFSYWEMVGTLVNRGLLHDEIFFEHTGEELLARA